MRVGVIDSPPWVDLRGPEPAGVDVLAGRDPHPRYQALTPADRRAIVEILRETKPNLPSSFTPLPS